MQFQPTPADRAFAEEIKMILREILPPDLARRARQGFHTSREDMKRWNAILNERGWAAPHWPREVGGTGWTPMQSFLFDAACTELDAPALSVFGLKLVGPVIYTYGSAAQKREHLPPILRGDVLWCQGFSEPGSGSDLASLTTRAVRHGDHYIVNGRKLWTTEAHYADKMFLLARTDAMVSKQRGLSFLLLDMKQPGITVRPVITLDEGHSVNEVFLDDVRVPAEDLVGEEGAGWSYAKFLLGNERTANAQIHRSRRDLARVKEIAALEHDGTRRVLDDPSFRQRLARVEIDLKALEWAVLRVLVGEVEEPASAASALKVQGSVLQQQISGLAIEALGLNAVPFYDDPEDADATNLPSWAPDYAPGLMGTYLHRRATTIYAGTNEIQRGIIAKQALGF